MISISCCCVVMSRRPPRSTLLTHSFPTRRSADLPSMPRDPVEMADECSQMGVEVGQEAPALWAEHCSPDHAVAPDTGFAHVPPLALPPVHFEPSVVPPPAHQVLAGQRLVDRYQPPPDRKSTRLNSSH